ncbi:MAG: Gfo/Idh/MocA family oxidoreductase [Anaerolineae bacterium]
MNPTITFAAIGAAHPHVYSQVDALLHAGASLKWFFDHQADARAEFAARYPQARLAVHTEQVLSDPDVQLIVGTVPHDERAALGITVMQHGKDYLCAKPGFTTIEQLKAVNQVQQETERIYSIFFGERFDSPATIKALEIVQAGRIGRVVQTIGMGPHRLFQGKPRPDWVFDRARYGGILNDLASHQIDQFMLFTGSQQAEIVSAQVGQAKFQQFAAFEDFGDLTLRSDHATGYIRVDWLTPDGMPTWGDVRLFVIGTNGSIEIRKNVDLDGQQGANHLFVVDESGVERIMCESVELPFARQLINDVLNRTETAMTQAHCFTVSELALIAQSRAQHIALR